MSARFLEDIEKSKKRISAKQSKRKVSRILLFIDFFLIVIVLIYFFKREHSLEFLQPKIISGKQSLLNNFMEASCKNTKCSFVIPRVELEKYTDLDILLQKTTQLSLEVFHHSQKVLNIEIPTGELQSFFYREKPFSYVFPWNLEDSYYVDIIFLKKQKRLTFVRIYPDI